MQTAILTLHVIVCLFLVVLVLLQAGREGMGVIFGGGGNSSVFGSSGAGGVLVKLTTFLAVLFIVTSLGYNIITSSGHDKGSSVLDVQFEEVTPPADLSVPSVTGAGAAPVTTNAPAAVTDDASVDAAAAQPETSSAAEGAAVPADETPAGRTPVEAPGNPPANNAETVGEPAAKPSTDSQPAS